jgi:GntR family transcriptional repressor for pyruvate dehydrogenase complex
MEARIDKRRPVYEEIREYIREMIRKGDLREGDKLPAERKLSQKFLVSRNSVREAIRALAEMGIVESRHGDGTYVRNLGQSDWAHLNRVVQYREKRLGEIFQFRRILEPQIAALAARHVTRKEIDRLKVLVFEQERRIMEGEDDSDLDAEFHLRWQGLRKTTLL